MIPKIIHQIWNTDVVPAVWQDFVISWHKHHPGWRYYLWSAERRKAYVATYLPDYLKTYNRFRRNVQKADVFRYIILERMGGIYADLDMECLKPFDEFVDGHSFMIGKEPKGAGSEWGRKYVYGNAMLVSEPGHPFLKLLLSEIKQRKPNTNVSTDVLTSTGTFLLTDMLDAYRREHGTGDNTVLGPEAFYPYGAWTRELYALIGKTDEAEGYRQSAIDSGSVGIHYWWGGWLNGFGGGRLNNPNPNDVEGFVFFPGIDSTGNNVGRGKRDVVRLAQHARDMGHVQGFNTMGEFKSKISAPSMWHYMDKPKPNEGLYIKTEYVELMMP